MRSNFKSFFIFGSPRSGTTFVTKLLSLSTNAKVFIEQSPKLGYESREKYLGHFKSHEDAKGFIRVQKDSFIKDVNNQGFIYGDKNPNFLPFLKEMSEAWPESKFVYVYRDGRDVVKSIMNWHFHGKNIFQMAEDIDDSGTIFPIQDLWDYSRLRPIKGEQYYSSWKKYTQFEKCCINWHIYNELALKKLSDLAPERYIKIDITNANVDAYLEIFDFLSLKGISKEEVIELSAKKINTSDANIDEKKRIKDWSFWEKEKLEAYKKFSGETHKLLFGEFERK